MFICLILIIISILLQAKQRFQHFDGSLSNNKRLNAILNGFDIKTQREQVYMSIRICPQHDILWDDLTEWASKLLSYACLKSVPSSQERVKVIESLERVRLVPFENRLTRGLSGGEDVVCISWGIQRQSFWMNPPPDLIRKLGSGISSTRRKLDERSY